MANEVVIVVRGEDRASVVMDRIQKKGSGLGKVLGDVTKIAGGFVLAQGMMRAPAVIGGITSTARDLELQMKKATTVFGDQLGVIEDWADANAHAMGLTTRQAVNAAAGFADLLIPMGFTREAAAGMAGDVVGLSGALAEWSGGTRSAEEVSKILAKAMLGEREQLKELGISITEADVKQRLMEKGQEDLTGAALQQAKAMATQELIFEKSQDAQTAYAEGAGSAARKQAELTAKLNEAKETLALKLGPAITQALSGLLKLAEIIEQKVIPVIREWWREHQPQIQRALENFRAFVDNNVIPVIQKLVAMFEKYWPKIQPIVEGVFKEIQNIVSTAMEVIGGIIEFVMAVLQGDWGKAWDALKGIVTDTFEGMKESITNRLNIIKDVMVLAGAILRDLFQEKMVELKDKALEAMGALKDKLLEAMGALKDKLGEYWQEIVMVALAILFPPAGGLFALVTNSFGLRDKLLEAFRSIKDMIFGVFWDIVGEAKRMGERLLRWMWEGILSMKEWFLDRLKDFKDMVTGILDPRNWFSTPAKHYAKVFGEVPDAIAGALNRGLPAVRAAAESMREELDRIAAGPTGGMGAELSPALARAGYPKGISARAMLGLGIASPEEARRFLGGLGGYPSAANRLDIEWYRDYVRAQREDWERRHGGAPASQGINNWGTWQIDLPNVRNFQEMIEALDDRLRWPG